MKLAVLILLSATAIFAADPTGKWTSTFDTQIGPQNYTYELKADGKKLTGKAINQSASSTVEIQEGKVEGETVSFVENFVYDGNPLRIEYTGKFDGPDRIKFTRKVADYAVEEIVANRAK